MTISKKTLRKKLNSHLSKYSLCIIGVLTISSCEKFVDIKASSSVSLIQSANDCQLLLNDYTNMNTGYPSDNEISADDYYLDNSTYQSTTISTTDRDLYIWSPTAIRNLALPQWQTPYHIIYLSNLVIENVEKLRGSYDEVLLDDLKGQALFFRAYNYWQLAQVYTQPYQASTATQDQGVPIRLSSDINGKSSRGTLAQTYDQIINDLQSAAGLLSLNSVVASRPNKVAAFAMLARVYLSIENYPQALIYSNLALQSNNGLMDFNSISQTSNTPFQRFNKEVIFHSLTTAGATLSPNGPTDNIAKIDLSLISTYSVNDLRRQIYFKSNTGSSAGTFRFTGNYEPTTSSTFFNGLAVDELFITRAECNARAGNISSAMSDLNTLLKTRWLSGTYVDMVASSTDEALNKILIERRKELLMRNLRWTDLRRLNKDTRFAKILTRTINESTYILNPNDIRYTLLIPSEVIINSEINQNLR